jgi:hypothetical protein
MSFCSAFGQWDTTAHQQLPPLDMASWMPAQGVSGVGSNCDIHQTQSEMVTYVKLLFQLVVVVHSALTIPVPIVMAYKTVQLPVQYGMNG